MTAELAFSREFTRGASHHAPGEGGVAYHPWGGSTEA
jgi:hypothetical protein